MLERMLLPEKHAISILLKDHDTTKELFDRFEKSESGVEREKIIAGVFLTTPRPDLQYKTHSS